MEVELPKVKEDFATIVESITLQPWTMLQFIIWLDLKLAEYKLNGSMSLDKSVGAIPDWLAGISVDQPEETVEPPKQQMLPPPTHEEENSSDTVITGQEEEEEIPEEYEDDEIYEDEILPNSDDNLSLSQPPSALSQGHSDLGEDDPEEHEHENNVPVNSESWGPNIASKRPADMRESNKPEMSPSDIKRQKVPQGATMPTMHESFHPEMSPSDKKRPIVPQGASMPMMQEKFHPEMNRSDIKRLNAPQGAPMHMMRKAGAWGTRQNVHGRLEQHSGHVTIVRDPNRATFVGDPNRSTIIRDPNRPHSGNIIYRNPRGGVQSSIIANKVEQSIDQREYFDDDEMFDYNTNPDVMSMGNTGTYASAHRMFANRNRTSNVNREKRVSSTVTSHSVSNVSPFLEMDPLDEEMSPDDEEFDDDPTHITQIAHRGVSRTAVPISSNAKDPIPTQMFVNKQELSKQGPQHHQTEIEPRSSQEETRTDANEPFGNISQSENSENFDQSLNFPADFQIKTEPEDPTPSGYDTVDPRASTYYQNQQNTMDHLRNIKIEPEERFVKAKRKRTYNKHMREEIARYAIENSIGLAAKRFSDELGFVVRHSTVTRMKDSYIKAKQQASTRAAKPKNYKYDPCIREEIARYAMRHGTSIAARQFTLDLGHPVTYSTVARMRESYAKKYKIKDDAANKQEEFDDYE